MKNISHRIVHFDLKGAPWKVPYLEEVIVVAKQWGATGIIFEWEDSFPYMGPLINIGSLGGSNREGLYSPEEIKHLLQFTADNGLEPIQLVQTLGHLEFVLKHEELAHLRELRLYPAVLCPTRCDGRNLVIEMVKQVLAMQPDAKFIHIGADEAWHYNKCETCIKKSSVSGVDSLFIDHIRKIVEDVKKSFPNVQVLIWDDMMREIQELSLLAAKMSNLVIPVVWHYGPVGRFNLHRDMWLKYDKCFNEIWVGSAFKGANGSNQMLSSVEHYVSNQEAWLKQIQQLEGCRWKLQITGVILTGWSRFDHYATLCELLPVSMPSLFNCLKMWTKRDNEPASSAVVEGEWPGSRCARAVLELHACRARCLAFLDGEMVGTWMNSWQLEHGYTSAMHVIPIGDAAKMHSQELNAILGELAAQLRALTGPRSAAEWLHTHAQPAAGALQRLARRAAARARLPPAVAPARTEIRVPEC